MSWEVSSLRALAHPVRLRILSLLTGSAMSAAELARELGITQANASYHLRRLAAAGEVVEAGAERIRGGVAKRYRYPWDDPPEHQQDDQDEHRLYVQAMVTELVRRSQLRQPSSSGVFTDADLWVDPEVWQGVLAQVRTASLSLHAAARPPRSDDTVRVNMTAALFEMQSQPPTRDREPRAGGGGGGGDERTPR